ncbi:MAG: hypothetical protein ACI4MQ_06030 [Candidatus Coproplasma sp.]
MNVSKELLEKAKTAKSAEELLALAKAENIELTEGQAAKAFAQLNKNGELSDEELDNVAGGGKCDNSYNFKYNVGDHVIVKGQLSTNGDFSAVIEQQLPHFGETWYHMTMTHNSYGEFQKSTINGKPWTFELPESQIIGLHPVKFQ